MYLDIDLEMAITTRELTERVITRIQNEQMGEAWVNLDTRSYPREERRHGARS